MFNSAHVPPQSRDLNQIQSTLCNFIQEEVNFSQMHHVKCGERLSLYNHMHKFKHILCEDFKVGGSAILYYAGLTTHFMLLH